jgi:hypothetical protein
MSRPALPEERGADLRRDRAEPVPEGLRHSVERIDYHDGQPFERCAHCGSAGSIGSINPFAECPARDYDGQLSTTSGYRRLPAKR